MARERVLKVTILGDANSARRALGSLNTGLVTTQSRFSRFASGLRKAAYIATPAIIAVGAGIGYALKQAAEAEKVGAQTEAVLKSTGRSANVTKRELEGLSRAIMGYSGMSDEAVQSAGNLLLTFTSVRNEVGKNNQVFNDALKIAADMSVALDQDLRTSVMQVGKAFQDPVRGMTALRRAGVNFSEKQEAVITKLVETGDKIGAQKFLLKELRKEFEGSARAAGDTFGGKLDILQEKLGNVAERIGKRLMPVALDMVNWLDKNLPDVIAEAGVILGGLAEGFGNVAKAAVWVYNKIRAITDAIAGLINAVINFGEAAKRVLFDTNVDAMVRDALHQQNAALAAQARATGVSGNQVGTSTAHEPHGGGVVPGAQRAVVVNFNGHVFGGRAGLREVVDVLDRELRARGHLRGDG